MQESESMGPVGTGEEDRLLVRTLFEGRCAVVEATGEIEMSTVELLRPVLFRTCEATAAKSGTGQPEDDGAGEGVAALPCVIVDLRGVTFLDSAGMGLLVEARRAFAGRCDLVLAAAEGGHPARGLRLARLERAFRIVRSPDELDR